MIYLQIMMMIFHSGVKLPEGTLLMFHRGVSPAGTHQVLLIFHGSLQMWKFSFTLEHQMSAYRCTVYQTHASEQNLT